MLSTTCRARRRGGAQQHLGVADQAATLGIVLPAAGAVALMLFADLDERRHLPF